MNPINNMFNDEKVTKWFNKGYNPDDRYIPINKDNRRRILNKLNEISNKAVFEAINQVKNCSAFNKLFGSNVEKFLSRIQNKFTFTYNIPGGGSGTVGNYGIFVKDNYLENFLYHVGRQAREIDNGQRTDFDLTPGHFDYGWGGKAAIPIKINVSHELMHALSGFNGGGREAECIVHCLTKKCIDSNYDFKDVEVETIINWNRTIVPISCQKIAESFWKGKEDIAHEMNAGNCFCGIQWIKNIDCDEQTSATATGSKKKRDDSPDDHYSFASGTNYITNLLSTTLFDFPIEGKRNYISFNFYPDVLIYEKYFGDIQNLLKKYDEYYISDYVHDYFSNNHKILFIGSSELIGDEKSAIIKQALENFVANGGVLFIQTQQYGNQITDLVPIPENESLKFVGFRQDQSCIRNSGYFQSVHPAVSSSTKELLDMGLDGYFPVYPSDSTVLIRRRISQEPALLYYPYKNGWVILGANFTDYSLSKSMASTAELRIVRDVLAFAKNPGMPILMVDLEQEPIPTISREAVVRNPTEETAVKAILKVYTPDKDQVLYETQQNITLNPGDHGQVPITFSLPGVAPGMYGIWHVFYELYNPDNDLIYAEESDAARFALYKITDTYTSNRAIDAWITVKDELVYFSEPAAFEFHLRNNTTETKTIDLKYTWNHDSFKTDLQTVTIPAGEQLDLQFDINAPPYAHLISYYQGGTAGMMFRLWYGPAQTNQYSQATKGIQFITPKTKSSFVQIQPNEVPVGKPFSYTIKVINESNIEIVDTALAVTLEKMEWPGNNYVQVDKIYETLHTFSAGETFSYNGNYTPTTPHESGMYRLKMEVQKPEGTREEKYSNFLYINSNIGISVEPLSETSLAAGAAYPVKIVLAKKSFLEIFKGRYSLLFKTPDGQIACRKDVENLVLKGYHSIPIEDSLTFNPAILAPYYRLEVEYSDETMLTPRVADSGKRYQFKYSAALALDKEVYLYRETANVSLNLTGAGTFDVRFTCAAAGIDEQRVVTIPPGSVGTVEVFQVPIGLENYYNPRFTITSREGLYPTSGGQLSIPIPVLPLKLEANGAFAEITAKEEKPLEFNLTIKSISGLGSPLTGLLKVSLMNYTDVQNVTLAAQGDNNFYYHIPVGNSIGSGIYNTHVTFENEGILLISKNYAIKIPAAGIKLSTPPSQLSAGDSFLLALENPGGINGNYQWEVYLKDPKGQAVLEYAPGETFPINAGDRKEITLEIPIEAASGPYFLLQKVKETLSAREEVNYSRHQVSGISAALNAYTLKEKYFENEPVSGQVEITTGNAAVENAQLRARIVRYTESKGIEEETPGEFIPYNMIENGCSSGNMLYLVTDKGVIRHDVVSGSVEVLYSFDSNPAFNSTDLMVSSTGEVWAASWYGAWKLSPGTGGENGQWDWVQYTTSDGLVNNAIENIIEVNGTSGSEIWMATDGGISVYRNGQWVNYTTADGLPSNYVYKVTLDGSGAVWASTSSGVVKFNGTGFESVNAPFGSTRAGDRMTAAADGSVWLAAGSQLYRYQPDTDLWNAWPLLELFPTPFISIAIYDMKTINGQLWLSSTLRNSQGKYLNGLIHYNGSFVTYTQTEVPGLTGLDTTPLIPGSADGDTAYFACEIGFIANNSGTWQHRVVEIDNHKLPAKIYCMVKDKNGRLWAGTEYGLSGYDVNSQQWTNYCSTPGNELILDVLQVDSDGQNNVYGYSPYLFYPFGGIMKININNDDSNIETISFPSSGIQHSPFGDNRMAVDTLGRTWFGYEKLYYYDETGEWHQFPEVNIIRCMIKDFSGGVWLGAVIYRNDLSNFHLLHIKNDFTTVDYTSANSELIPWDKGRLYLDQEGILWIAPDYYEESSLQSFDGSNWTDYSNYEGFPQSSMAGLANMVKDDSGKLWVLDYAGKLYSLENNQFIVRREGIFSENSMEFVSGKLYSAGNRYGYSFNPTNFIKISSAEGLIEEELWSQNYPVNLLSGGADSIDLLTNKTFSPGAYELKTALLSPLNQELAVSDYGFVVKDEGLSVSSFANRSSWGFLKPDTDLGVTVEVLNNTPESKSNLSFTLKKLSPGGAEQVIQSTSLTLAPGQVETFSFTFNESAIGTWRLAALLKDNSSGEEKESTLLIGVTAPEVTMEILAPEYAGDENFDVKLRLSNEGNIDAQLNVQVSAGSETPMDETFTLQPLEERILTINDSISADKTYTFALTGDVEKIESKTVKYGYVENLNMDIQSAYREGMVSIGYTLTNGGGLAFTNQVHFEIYAIGGTLPLYTVERNYRLYPDQAPIMDTIDIPLSPGNYELKYNTIKMPTNYTNDANDAKYANYANPGYQSMVFSVQPSGIGAIVINPASPYPVGAVEIPFSITNIDTAPGYIPVTVALIDENNPGDPINLFNPGYYLLPGEAQNDVIHHEFVAPGTYSLSITGTKLPAPINSIIQVKNLEQISANITVEEPESDLIPVKVTLENSGCQPFIGTVAIEEEGLRHEEIIEVTPGGSFAGTLGLNTSLLSPGSKEVKAYLYDNAGNAIAQTSHTVELQPANIKLVDLPQNLEINAGSIGQVNLTLKNQGNLRGEAILKINAFDTLDQQWEMELDPGEEIQPPDIFIEVPADLPGGSYPFYYTLKGSGVENGSSAGNFYFKVNGLSLDIDASLDRPLYNPGETAALTLNITGDTTSDAPLEAVVNWGIFSETRPFNLNSGSASLVFDIPLDEARQEKVFYGIYHEGGKGIHLNDIYLNFRGEISLETDKQVYAPGEIIHAFFSGEHTGALTVSAFDESYTLDFSSSVSASFQVPVDTLGGTYGISWSLTPADVSKPELSGSQSFDVSGLVVKVAKSVLEKGKYEPGEIINAHYIFESNQDQTLKLRNWVAPPSGDWTYLGESSVIVSSQQQIDAVSGYSFNTTEAGTHELVYGLYQSEACETCGQLVVSGRLSFDVGNAVLLGISTDQWEYKNGNEPVTLKIDHFGEGFAQLQILLDEENVHQQGISLNGTGSTAVVLQSSSISGGSHMIKAVLIQDNLTSTKTTGFTYGTHLPDLTAWLTDTLQDGLYYSFKIKVSNSGQTTSTASSLLFSDNSTDVGTASIPALEPNQSHEATFNWNGTGKAGSHELTFTADNTNTVKEFSESNNSAEFTLEVPALFYSLETDPSDKLSYPANTPINIIARLINNQETPALLTLDLAITNDESGVIIHNSTKEAEIPGFASQTITDTFNTEIYPSGNYTTRGTLFEKTVPLDPRQKLLINMVRELFLYFEPTEIVTGTLQVQPQQIPTKTPTEVTLTMTLKNAGNVPLEDEILHIDVFNKDLGEVAISEELPVSIPLAQEITKTKTMSLNLAEGNYEIWLKHNEEILSITNLSAISNVKPTQTIGIYPRVLIINLNEKFLRGPGAVFSKRAPGQSNNPVDYLTALLHSQGIEYEIGLRLLDSYVKLNKGQANVNIVLGNEMGGNLRDELKEKVFHGEGLILFCDKPAQNPEWTDFLGVAIKPIPGKTRESIMQILPNEFCSEGEIECAEKPDIQITKEKEDVVIIAQTKQNKYPLITYRKYGKGNILLLPVPIIKSFCGGSRGAVFSKRAPLAAGGIEELLLNAVGRFSRDIYTGTDLTRLLPLELSLKNESSEAAALKIKTFLPYGVEAFDFKPEPEEGEELEWRITVPAVSTETISYWLKLPDQVNSFEIKTELYEEETKLDEVSTSFEVVQTVLYRINELLMELDMAGAVGKDAPLISKARRHLEQIRNRTVNSFMEHLLNLHDSVKAAVYLGEVKSIDVSTQRIKAGDIMVIMGRRFYEAVKTWSEAQLGPILELL